MKDAADIKAAVARSEDRIRAQPKIGHLTKTSKATVEDGLTCHIEDGPWNLTADMRKSLGGQNSEPDPGVFGRAAISSCLAIGYATWFARLDVPVNHIEVEVAADFDYGGVLGTSDSAANYSQLRYSASIDSPAAKEEIIKVLDWADAHSPWLSNMKTAFEPRRSFQITSSREAG